MPQNQTMFDRTNEILNDGKDGFKNIFQQFFQPLCHLSSHYLEDPDEAKEVVQDAFVKLWEVRRNRSLDKINETIICLSGREDRLDLANFRFSIAKKTFHSIKRQG